MFVAIASWKTVCRHENSPLPQNVVRFARIKTLGYDRVRLKINPGGDFVRSRATCPQCSLPNLRGLRKEQFTEGTIHMMTLAKIQTAAAVLVVATVVTIVNVVVVEHVGGADEKNLNVPLTLTPRQFTSYQALIKPAAHESPWANRFSSGRVAGHLRWALADRLELAAVSRRTGKMISRPSRSCLSVSRSMVARRDAAYLTLTSCEMFAV
jgi:hypothetical protein